MEDEWERQVEAHSHEGGGSEAEGTEAEGEADPEAGRAAAGVDRGLAEHLRPEANGSPAARPWGPGATTSPPGAKPPGNREAKTQAHASGKVNVRERGP